MVRLATKIYLIIIGAVSFIPINIGMQMILPFPYGIVGGLGVGITVLLIFIKKAIKEDSSSIRSGDSTNGITAYCKKCGSKIDSKNNFCIKCGTELNDEK